MKKIVMIGLFLVLFSAVIVVAENTGYIIRARAFTDTLTGERLTEGRLKPLFRGSSVLYEPTPFSLKYRDMVEYEYAQDGKVKILGIAKKSSSNKKTGISDYIPNNRKAPASVYAKTENTRTSVKNPIILKKVVNEVKRHPRTGKIINPRSTTAYNVRELSKYRWINNRLPEQYYN